MLTLNQVVADTIQYHLLCCSMSMEKAKSEVGKLIQSFKRYKDNEEASDIQFYANMNLHKNPISLAEYLQGYIMAETDGYGFGCISNFDCSER